MPSGSGSIEPANVDPGVRRRLLARFGPSVELWFGALPDVLDELSERWRLTLVQPIPRGSVSVVLRCRLSDGRPAVLKTSPDRRRLAGEAAALGQWATPHAPAVLTFDEPHGALLIEAIEPGTPLVEGGVCPGLDQVAGLMNGLHRSGLPKPFFPPLAERVRYLFVSGAKPYERTPEVADVVPRSLYERGRRLATRLAERRLRDVLLHGDLTPSNILDGGCERGLVAIDPAPCVGDPAFDAVDLLLWTADSADTVAARADQLAPALGTDAERLLDWCRAFAAMIAVELAESGAPRERLEASLALADRAT
jgi:streptomycin 6-kinase